MGRIIPHLQLLDPLGVASQTHAQRQDDRDDGAPAGCAPPMDMPVEAAHPSRDSRQTMQMAICRVQGRVWEAVDPAAIVRDEKPCTVPGTARTDRHLECGTEPEGPPGVDDKLEEHVFEIAEIG